MEGCDDGRVLGAYGRNELNDNGKRLLSLAADNKLALSNTFCSAHKGGISHTFNGINSRNDRKRIDYILTRHPPRPRVRDVKVNPHPPSPAKADADRNIVYTMVPPQRSYRTQQTHRYKHQIRPFDRQTFRSHGDCRQRVVARIISKLPDLFLQSNRISEMGELFTNVIRDAVEADIPSLLRCTHKLGWCETAGTSEAFTKELNAREDARRLKRVIPRDKTAWETLRTACANL